MIRFRFIDIGSAESNRTCALLKTLLKTKTDNCQYLITVRRTIVMLYQLDLYGRIGIRTLVVQY